VTSSRSQKARTALTRLTKRKRFWASAIAFFSFVGLELGGGVFVEIIAPWIESEIIIPLAQTFPEIQFNSIWFVLLPSAFFVGVGLGWLACVGVTQKFRKLNRLQIECGAQVRTEVNVTIDESCDLIDPSQQPRKSRVREVLQNGVNQQLATLKTKFDELTDDDCRLCVKIMHDEHNAIPVYRNFGDSLYHAPKRKLDVRKHTACVAIIAGKRCYVENDIATALAEGRYSNGTKEKHIFGNAQLCVPIWKKTKGDKDLSNIQGFLFIENIKGGFSERDHIRLVELYADGIGMLLKLSSANDRTIDLRLREVEAA